MKQVLQKKKNFGGKVCEVRFLLRELGFEKCGALRKVEAHISQLMGATVRTL